MTARGRHPNTLASLRKNGAKPGNKRALKHGAKSQIAIQTERERHQRELLVRFPGLDVVRVALLADRLARIAVASAWLDQQKGVVKNSRGDIYAVAEMVERWSQAAERALAELEAEYRKSRRFDLAQAMGQLEDEDGKDG